MEELSITSIVLLVAGIVIGIIATRLLTKRSTKEVRLESDIHSMKKEFNEKLHDITQHYETTQALLDKLLVSYKDIQSHVSNTEEVLKPPVFLDDQGLDRLPSGKNEPLPAKDSKGTNDSASPPKDYAPKTTADEKGTLSEDFGLGKPKEK